MYTYTFTTKIIIKTLRYTVLKLYDKNEIKIGPYDKTKIKKLYIV